MPKRRNNNVNGESGNAFLVILIGVVLMGALMFTFTRSARQGGTDMSDREAAIAVSDVMAFAQRAQRAVDRIMRRGDVSEVDLSFETALLDGYENANCTKDKCKVFNVSGGGLTYSEPQVSWFDKTHQGDAGYGTWIFTGDNAVKGAGNDCADASCNDIVMVLPYVKENLCLKLNQELNIDNPDGMPPKTSGGISLNPFTGAYTVGETMKTGGDDAIGPAACVWIDSGPYANTNMFYNTIKAR